MTEVRPAFEYLDPRFSGRLWTEKGKPVTVTPDPHGVRLTIGGLSYTMDKGALLTLEVR